MAVEQRYIQKKDIYYRLLRKWKHILLWTCIGAVAGGLLGWFFAKHYDYAASYLKKVALEYESELTDDEIEKVNKLIKDESKQIEDYASYLGYKNQSVTAQLDYEAVDTLYVTYALKGREEDLAIYKNAVAEYLVSGDVMAEAVASLNISIYQTYIRELLQISYSDDQSIITLRIRGKNSKMCRSIADVLQDELKKNLAEELDLQLSDTVTVEFVEQRLVKEYSEEVLSVQKERAARLLQAEEQMRLIAQNLNDHQRNYFYAVLANKKNVPQIYSDNVYTGYYRLRYSILGIFIFGLIACICVILKYIFSKNLRSASELSETRGMPLLGIIVRRMRKDRKLVHRMYGQHGEDTKAYILSQIEQEADQCGVDCILVISSDDQNVFKCEYIAEWINELDGLHAFTEQELHEAPERNVIGVILLETVEKALYEQILNVLNNCKEQNRVVVGYIAEIV